jgi:hypothetical protein
MSYASWMSIFSSTSFILDKQSTTPPDKKILYVGGDRSGNYTYLQKYLY